MIISHKYKFIFIKTEKTAGTSIEVFLSQVCDDNDVFTPITPPVPPHIARNYKGFWNPLPEIIQDPHSGPRLAYRVLRGLCKQNRFYNHMPAKKVKARLPLKIWDEYFKFCVERNPWDKTLSHYHMFNARVGGNLSFDKYLKQGTLCVNYHRYTDVQDNLLVDRVAKYESLEQDLSELFNSLEIPFEKGLDVRAKSEYRKDKRKYQEVYSSEQKEIIERAFSKEIEMHGYKFC